MIILGTRWGVYVEMLINWSWCAFNQAIRFFIFLQRESWELCSQLQLKKCFSRYHYCAYIELWEVWRTLKKLECQLFAAPRDTLTPLFVFIHNSTYARQAWKHSLFDHVWWPNILRKDRAVRDLWATCQELINIWNWFERISFGFQNS